MRSHIHLDDRPYTLRTDSYRKVLSNPMAAKTSRGSSRYSDETNWDYFVQADWSSGIGNTTPDEGFLFTMGDARFSNQFTCISSMVPTDSESDGDNTRKGIDSTLVIGSGVGANFEKVVRDITGLTGPTDTEACLLAMIVETPASTTTITVDVFEMSANEPTGSSLYNTTITLSSLNLPGLQYVTFPLTWTAVGVTEIGVVLGCATTFTIGTLGDTSPTYGTKYYNGSSWVGGLAGSYGTAAIEGYVYKDFAYQEGFWPKRWSSLATAQPRWLGKDGEVYTGYGNGIDGESSYTFTGVTNVATDAVYSGTHIYAAYGSNHNLFKMTVAGAETDLAVNADKLEIGGGYLWRSYNKSLYYSADESTWTEIEVNDDIYDIVFWNDFCWMATPSGLYRAGYGDVPLITLTLSLNSSVFMRVFQNRLFIANDDQLYEFDGSTVRNVSPMSGDGGLPYAFNGKITAMYASNYFLYAGISAAASDGNSGVYAYNGSGWCLLHSLGSNATINDMYMRYTSYTGVNELYANTDVGFFKSTLHEQSQYVATSGTAECGHPAWFETAWYYGGMIDLEKDWESVSIIDNIINTNTYSISVDWTLSVYWKVDDASTWVKLGETSFDSSDGVSEFRWSDYTTRPATERLKLGVLIVPKYTASSDIQRLRIEAIRTKYQAMVTDRWQWSLVIPVTDKQELPDGTINPYESVADMTAHLDTLARQTQPFIFQDVDGLMYEVKVLSASVNITEYDFYNDDNQVQLVYSIAIEQVNDAVYVES